MLLGSRSDAIYVTGSIFPSLTSMYPIIELPSRSEPYSSSVYNAVDILHDILRHSHTLLQKGQYDVHRVEYYLDSIIQDAVPIVIDLTETEEENGLPKDWTNSVMKMFTDLIHSLMEAHKTALGVYVSLLIIILWL